MADEFVVHRLRSKPVEYSIRIRHFVSGGAWMMSVTVEDVPDDSVNRERVLEDLREAVRLMERAT